MQKDVPIIREVNNVVGSIVALENSILAPLAPFGRKLQSVGGPPLLFLPIHVCPMLFFDK